MEKIRNKKEKVKKNEVISKAEIPGDDYNEEDGLFGKKNNDSKKNSKSSTPVLDNFGRDLTKYAEEGKLDPIVGREKEIERVSQILSRRKKNNPILIGEPGCVDGNTKIVIRKISNNKEHNIINK